MGNLLIERIKKEQESDATMKWIEKHDRLYSDRELTEKLKMENQLAFWRKNCDIRKALDEIEKELKTSSKHSIRLVGWSEIARRAKCDRNTLKKIERFKWVNEERERLLNKIKKQNEPIPPLSLVMSEEDKIIQLERKLALCKEEAAKWFVKYEDTHRELQLVKESLTHQMEANSRLTEQNKLLIKEIKR